jgi:hypothetical protein
MGASAVEIGQREIGTPELAGFDAASADGHRGFTRLEGGAGRGIVLLRICEAHCAGKESATNRGGTPRRCAWGSHTSPLSECRRLAWLDRGREGLTLPVGNVAITINWQELRTLEQTELMVA